MRLVQASTAGALRHARQALGVLAILTATAALALAGNPPRKGSTPPRTGSTPPSTGTRLPVVPEINPGAMLGGLTLLIGGGLILADRSRHILADRSCS